MSELIKYEEARRALAECASIDEVKDIQDKSEAMRLYAKMSENTELEVYASTIKLRAQIRLGEIIATIEKQPVIQNLQRPTGGSLGKKDVLADSGISKSSAQRYETAARVPEEVVEKYIKDSVESSKPVSLRDVVAHINPPKQKTPVTPKIVPPVVPAEETITISKSDYDELISLSEDLHAAQKDMESVLEADDKLTSAAAEIRSLNEQVRVLRTRLQSEQNKNNELIKIVKGKDKQIAKLEKELETYKLEDLPL